MPGPRPIRQRGLASRIPQENQPRARARGQARGSALKDARLAGYLVRHLCPVCKVQTQHLILRRQIECKTCLVVRRRRPGDPPPA